MLHDEDIDITTDAATNDIVERHTEDEMPSATISSQNTSPFLLQPEDVETLLHSDGFSILREHLHEHYDYEFCEQHTADHLEDLDRWLIVRDVLHALLVPVVELFDKAVTVASQATHATKLEDLEYAFSGSARSAFVWLQCFLSAEKERDWCYTRGCPACVVDHSLDSEFSLRLLYAACLLSDVHYPFTLEGPTLPSFMFFLDSLARALDEDPLWRDNFFELMQPKAIVTRDGIEDLIHQCLELDGILVSQASSPSDPSSPEASVSSSPVLGPVGGAPGMKVKRSKMARRQMKLKVEEEAWMEEMLRKLAAETMPGMTLADREVVPQSIDGVVKAEPIVAVREVAPVT